MGDENSKKARTFRKRYGIGEFHRPGGLSLEQTSKILDDARKARTKKLLEGLEASGYDYGRMSTEVRCFAVRRWLQGYEIPEGFIARVPQKELRGYLDDIVKNSCKLSHQYGRFIYDDLFGGGDSDEAFELSHLEAQKLLKKG